MCSRQNFGARMRQSAERNYRAGRGRDWSAGRVAAESEQRSWKVCKGAGESDDDFTTSCCTCASAMLAKPRFLRRRHSLCRPKIEVPLEFQGLGSLGAAPRRRFFPCEFDS